jgi:outer membrane beta-barrel protein
LLLALPLAAAAQDMPGLDLSEPAKKPPEKSSATTQKPPEPEPAADDAAKQPRKAGALENALGAPGERDAALGDRVKAVQRKGFLKRNRLEGGVYFSPGLNDAFIQKLGVGARLAYHLRDSFALQLRGVTYKLLQVDPTDAYYQGQRAFGSQLRKSRLHNQLMLEGSWSPVYGKAAVLGDSIIHFDLFLNAGFGLAWSDTNLAPANQGAHFATDLGGGMRFYPREWLALEFGVLATMYPDSPPGSPSALQTAVVGTVGVSFFFPPNFEYVYP